MTRFCARNIAVSIDGYMAGPDQSLDAPLGVGGRQLHEWVFETKTGREMIGQSGGETGIDDDFMARGFADIGASLMGRNMFGPVRGTWESWAASHDDPWNGWWGDEPPYHHPVFVLTHQARPPLEMAGGTTFHFVTEGLERGVAMAREAAAGKDVRVNGGASTIRQCIEAGVLDELHLALSPVLLGGGERIFEPGGTTALDAFDCEISSSARVAHYRFLKR